MIIPTAVLTMLCAVACGGGAAPPAPQTATGATSSQTTTTTPSAGSWLGLNYNSSSRVGKLTEFSRYGIVYDRLGPFDIRAGDTTQRSPELAHGLKISVKAGMIPDVVISPNTGPSGCTTNPNTSNLCLPVTPYQVSTYVKGFVKTVSSIRAAEPGAKLVFEPMDEPWSWAPPPGTSSGVTAANDYAAILAQLLPAVRSAGIPLSLIDVPATGVLADSTDWVPDLYKAQPCLKPGAGSCGPIQGWNIHSYGPPGSSTGIAGVPGIRAQMSSGRNNILVSELGFCATDVLGGAECDENVPTVDGASSQVAHWLTQALTAGASMHAAGWLQGLIVWERVGGGWSMQLPNGTLTAQGQALIRFAQSQ